MTNVINIDKEIDMIKISEAEHLDKTSWFCYPSKAFYRSKAIDAARRFDTDATRLEGGSMTRDEIIENSRAAAERLAKDDGNTRPLTAKQQAYVAKLKQKETAI